MTTIITKNSSTAGAAPTAGDLVQGELAVNVTSKAIYTKNASAAVVKLNTPSIVDNGDATAITIDSSENVGIGTSSPTQKLDVAGASPVVKISRASGSQPRLGFGATSGEDFFIEANSATSLMTYSAGPSVGWGGKHVFMIDTVERMRIDSNGNLLVGTTSNPSGFKLNVSGTVTASGSVSFPQSNNDTTANAANMNIQADGYLRRSTSALKYKQDIRDLESIDVSSFRPVRYKSKCDVDDQTKDHFGLIADEVDAVGIKELVTYGEDGEVEGFQYERLTVVLVKAIQELKATVDAQAARITALEQA